MENRKIGAFLAERRKTIGLTQQALADRLGLTNKAVSTSGRPVTACATSLFCLCCIHSG